MQAALRLLINNADRVTAWLAWGMLLTAPVTFAALTWQPAAPYGRCACTAARSTPYLQNLRAHQPACTAHRRYSKAGWGPLVPARVAWLVHPQACRVSLPPACLGLPPAPCLSTAGVLYRCPLCAGPLERSVPRACRRRRRLASLCRPASWRTRCCARPPARRCSRSPCRARRCLPASWRTTRTARLFTRSWCSAGASRRPRLCGSWRWPSAPTMALCRRGSATLPRQTPLLAAIAPITEWLWCLPHAT